MGLEELKWRPTVKPDSVEEWVDKQRLDRDIVLLYHQLADYSGIMGDLYYGSVFALPYWDYLDPTGLGPEDQAFIREGCLVMILAMAWELIDGSGAYMVQFYERIRGSLALLADASEAVIEDERLQRLVNTVRLAVAESAKDRPDPSNHLVAESDWVHKEFVRGYFVRRAESFNSAYYGEADGE